MSRWHPLPVPFLSALYPPFTFSCKHGDRLDVPSCPVENTECVADFNLVRETVIDRVALAVIFNNVSHWAIGCYCLEWLLSLKFEFSVLTRRRPFRWPMLVCSSPPSPCYRKLIPPPLQLYFYTKWSTLCQSIPIECAVFEAHWSLQSPSLGCLLPSMLPHPSTARSCTALTSISGILGPSLCIRSHENILTRLSESPLPLHFSC